VIRYIGPWEVNNVSCTEGLQRESEIHGEQYRAHPLFAPLAWIACLVGGIAFWGALYIIFFLMHIIL